MASRFVGREVCGAPPIKTARKGNGEVWKRQLMVDDVEDEDTQTDNVQMSRVKNRKAERRVQQYGTVLQPVQEIPRSPLPSVLPALPSQLVGSGSPGCKPVNDPRSVVGSQEDNWGNVCPTGWQLKRTPPQEQAGLLEELPGDSAVPKGVAEQVMESSGEVPNGKERVSVVDVNNKGRASIRRKSSIPVHGLQLLDVDGALAQLGGYESSSTDVAFLQNIRNRQMYRRLKAERLACKQRLHSTLKKKEQLWIENDAMQSDNENMRFLEEVLESLCPAPEGKKDGEPLYAQPTCPEALQKLRIKLIDQVKDLEAKVVHHSEHLIDEKASLERKIREWEDALKERVDQRNKVQQLQEKLNALEAELRERQQCQKDAEEDVRKLETQLAEIHYRGSRDDKEVARSQRMLSRIMQRFEFIRSRQQVLDAPMAFHGGVYAKKRYTN